MESNNMTLMCIEETEDINELIEDVNQYLLVVQGISYHHWHGRHSHKYICHDGNTGQ